MNSKMSAAAGAAAASAARACLLVLLLVLTAAAVVSAMCTTLPPTPTNGVAYTTACSLPKQSGESCTTGCAAGYGYGSLSPPTAVCAGNNVWYAQGGSCFQCTNAPTAGTNVQSYTCANPTPGGNTCTSSCDPFYSTTGGTLTSTCIATNTWSTPTGTCIACTNSPATPDGNTNAFTSCAAVTSIGGTCATTCTTGFWPSTGTTITSTCTASNTWGAPSATCVPACSAAPTAPANGAWNCNPTAGSPILQGNTCTGTCTAPYSAASAPLTATCTGSDIWSAPSTTCIACTTQPPPEPNAATFACPTTAVGGTCPTLCTSPYSAVGSIAATCTVSGGLATWAAGAGSCVACTSQPSSVTGADTYACGLPIGFGGACTTTCSPNYLLTAGSLVRTCQSPTGTWSTPTATCTPQCTTTAPNTVLNAATWNCNPTTQGSTCTALCDNNYGNPSGGTSVTATCTGLNTWAAPVGSCVQCANQPSAVPNANTYTCATTAGGATCTTNCATGYTLVGGTLTRTCTGANTWSAATGSCVACTTPPSPIANANTYACANPTPVGATCTTTCASGYVPSGNTLSRTCNSPGTWSAIAGSCVKEAVFCRAQPNFTVPNAAPFSCSPQATSGSTCTTQCLSGFSGSVQTVCGQDGNWQAPTGSCSALSCQPLTEPKPDDSLGWPASCTSVSSLPSGTTCTAPCEPGTSGGVTATCTAGEWSISGACGDCVVQLLPPAQPLAAVCQGTTRLSANFSFQADDITSAQFAATVDGASCSPPPPGVTGPQPAGVNVPVTCTSLTPFAAGLRNISLTATVAAPAPCPATSTKAATTTIRVNPPPTLALAAASVNSPCPGENVTATFAFNITGLTAGAGALALDATASSSAAGTVCSVLSITKTEDSAAGRASGQVRATCRTSAGAGASVPVTVRLTARQDTCTGATTSTTTTATVACCATSGDSATGAAAVGASIGNSCWQHGAVNATCTTSTTPAVAPFFSSYLNRAPLANGVLRTGLQGACNSGGVDVGVASTSCIAAKTMSFNVTVRAGSSVRLWFWWGCRAPTNVTATSGGSCATWREVPAPGGPASTLQPAVTTSGAFTSYTWINTLSLAVPCDCSSMCYAVSTSGTFKLASGDCSVAAARTVRSRTRRGQPGR